MKQLYALIVVSLCTINSFSQPVIYKEDYGWTPGRTRNYRVGSFVSTQYDLTRGTGKTWTFTVPTGTDYYNSSYLASTGTTTFPTANLRCDYSEVITGYPYSGSMYYAVNDSDIMQLGYTGAPNTVWNPAIPTGLPHRLNKSWQGNYSYGTGTYHIVGTVIASGTSTSRWGTFATVLVRYDYSNVLNYTAYQWETQEYGIVAMANTLNGGIFYALNEAQPNTRVIEFSNTSPHGIQLGKVYPNPTNGIVTFQLSLTVKNYMDIRVLNSLGQEVMNLAVREYSAGINTIGINTESLASGNYWFIANQGRTRTRLQSFSVVR